MRGIINRISLNFERAEMDITLNCIKKGKGSALILLHGNNENSAYFTPQIDYFSKKRTVYAVDTRGHGKTPRGEAPFTIDQFAEDLKEFMDMRKIGKADILGFSDGANIALTFALKYPDYIAKLILAGANLYPSGIKSGFLLTDRIEYFFACTDALLSKKARRRKEMLELMIKQPDIEENRLAALKMPVLVTAGTRDMIKTEHTKLIAAHIKNSRLVFLEGDHFVSSKNYRLFNDTVDAFLKGQDNL
jgi:pimeloyl-ACP methyl ester carboxylesterase